MACVPALCILQPPKKQQAPALSKGHRKTFDKNLPVPKENNHRLDLLGYIKNHTPEALTILIILS